MKKLLLALVVGAMLNGVPAAAYANDEEAGCFEDLSNCYYAAAKHDSWIGRWLAGLDCELNFVECTRIKLVGK